MKRWWQSMTIAVSRLTADEIAIGKLLYPETPKRPKTRDECPSYRPCPYVGCRYNTYLEVTWCGNITIPKKGEEPWQVDPATSCTLDLADRGGMIMDDVAAIFRIRRQRVHQIEAEACEKLRQRFPWIEELRYPEPGSPDDHGEPETYDRRGSGGFLLDMIRKSALHKKLAAKRWSNTEPMVAARERGSRRAHGG